MNREVCMLYIVTETSTTATNTVSETLFYRFPYRVDIFDLAFSLCTTRRMDHIAEDTSNRMRRTARAHFDSFRHLNFIEIFDYMSSSHKCILPSFIYNYKKSFVLDVICAFGNEHYLYMRYSTDGTSELCGFMMRLNRNIGYI